jgi:sugar lactone lactonase YvrE
MAKKLTIKRIIPPAAITGGEIAIDLAPFHDGTARVVMIGGIRANVVATSPRRILAIVPNDITNGEVSIANEVDGKPIDETAELIVGTKMAGDLHPVANPAFDPSDGSLYVTRSGSRGEHVPVSLYRITSDGVVEEFSGDITNPTAIAFSPRGQMFVTSRLDGTVYRVSALNDCAVFAGELGIATGLAFNSDGDMFVGDRAGTIFKVNEIGEATEWAAHEPSVSAYHLAVGPDDALYVSGPTVSSFDSITRFDKTGAAEVFFHGLGRPQGLAFDVKGNLYVAASLRGRRGIVRISPDAKKVELLVAGMNVVGLAFGPNREMIVATNDSLYRLKIGIEGLLLSQDWALTHDRS